MYLKIAFNTLMYIIGIAFALAFFTSKCGGNTNGPAPKHDTLYVQETASNEVINKTLNELHLLKLVNDSLMSLKPKYITRYKTKYDSLIVTDTACKKSLNVLNYECVKLNDFKNSIINNLQQTLLKDSVMINALNDKISIKQSRITIDSTYTERLKDSIPKVKRKGFIKGFIYGFGSGVIITEGVNTAAKFIK